MAVEVICSVAFRTARLIGERASVIKPHIFVLLASVLVAGSFIASNHLAGLIHPASLTLLRFLIASVCLLPLTFLRSSALLSLLLLMPRALVLSFFYALFFVGMFEALTLTSTLNTATLYTLVPLITALMAAMIFKERIRALRLVVYLLGALGTLWVIFKGELGHLLVLELNWGDYLFALSSISMCCYAITMKLCYRNDDLWLFVWGTLLGAMMWVALLIVWCDIPLNWGRLEVDDWGDILYLSICTTLLTAYFYQRATVVLGPAKVTAYVYLNPAFVAMLAFFIDGVTIEAILAPGIVLSILATAFLLRGNKT